MGITLNEREQKLLQVAWQCMDVQPKIDYEKLAELSGLGTKGSATTAWCVLKKKLTAGVSTADSPIRAVTPKSTPRKNADGKRKNGMGSPLKRKIGIDQDDDEEELDVSKVAKRGKKASDGIFKTEDGSVAPGDEQLGEEFRTETPTGRVGRVKQEVTDEGQTFLQGLHHAADKDWN